MQEVEKNISVADWEFHTRLALKWLKRSVSATGHQGSAHSFHPLFGWAKAYPETSGYLIPTLMDYAAYYTDDTFNQLADNICNWLISIQLPPGAFAGLLAGNKNPSMFNTSQILFGLLRMGEKSRAALERAVQWLISQREQDGSWVRHAFVQGYTPAYYSRAIWALTEAGKLLNVIDIEPLMKTSLRFYARRFLDHADPSHWSFQPNEAAYTHTIAYTLEGFLESALALQESLILEQTIAAADLFLKKRNLSAGRTAGRYGSNWQGDFTFVCVPGNAQLSVFYHRLFQLTGEAEYLDLSRSLLREILPAQNLSGRPNVSGALPGSMPFWGGYLPFRYPNWSAKFFLDAMLLHRQVLPDKRNISV